MSDTAPGDGETLTLHGLLLQGARAGVDLQRDDGSFPPGRNYSYDEPETPVRTTSQWIRTMVKAYEISDETQFLQSADNAVDYLLSDEVRPHGYTFYCRNVESKDKCNGLVGQAHVIRALSEADSILLRDDARETAEELYLLHPFSNQLGLWERIEIDGQNLSFDRTLNHQIIFASASARLIDDLEPAEQQVTQFLDRLDSNMYIHPNGLIKHYIRPSLLETLGVVARTPRHRALVINEIAFHYYSHSKERKRKERGYQSVNLFHLAKLFECFPDHSFWNEQIFSKSLKYLNANRLEILNGCNVNHGHSLQGISMAKIFSVFQNESIENYTDLIKHNVQVSRGSSLFSFDLDSIDENTRKALIVTLTDLPNTEIHIVDDS